MSADLPAVADSERPAAARLRILHLEDEPLDSDLVRDTLAEAGYLCEFVRLETREDFEAALNRGDFDLILADYSLPSFDGMSALALARARRPDLPFILISGNQGEELAIEALKHGASDYVLKQRLGRLVPAARRALQDVAADRARKQAAAELWESEERYRTLVENAEDVILLTDMNGRQLFRNRAYYASLGYTEADAVEMDGFARVHPDDLPAMKHGMRGLLEGGASQSEYRIRHKDGRWLHRSARSNLIYDAARLPQSILTIIRDVSAQKQAAAQIAYQASLLNQVRNAVVAVDLDGRIVYWNRYAETLYQWTSGEALGKPVATVMISQQDAAQAGKIMSMLREQGFWEGEFSVQRKDGTVFPAHVVDTLIYDAAGVHIGMVGVSVDISERKRIEAQVQLHLSRLDALRAIDLSISGSFDLRATLNILLEQVIQQLGADAADVLLLDAHVGMLQYSAGRGFRNKHLDRVQVRVGEGYAGRVVQERRVLCIPNLKDFEIKSTRDDLFRAESFVSYFGAPLITKGYVMGVLEVFQREPLDPNQEWLDFFAALAGQAAIAADSAQLFNGLQRSNLELSLAYDRTIEGWSRALDLRDKETEGHTQRVTDIALTVARTMGFSPDELVHIRRGALLHDIGKMGVPDSILLKPGPLSDEEWISMRRHPVLAFELLSPVSFLRPALDIPYCHHEKWDGTGYPRGLKGVQIPRSARLFAVIDVWDALRSDRPYRLAWPEDKVRAHITTLSGTHFDPLVVEAFLRAMY